MTSKPHSTILDVTVWSDTNQKGVKMDTVITNIKIVGDQVINIYTAIIAIISAALSIWSHFKIAVVKKDQKEETKKSIEIIRKEFNNHA
nr:MAG: hypothetical protein [Microviridae sp.]